MIVSNLIAIPIIMGSIFFTNSRPDKNSFQSRGIPIVTYSFEEGDDKDYDRLPDRWIRAKGPIFPKYNIITIDRGTGSNGSQQSLRFDLKRNEIATYSPIKKIDAPHSYLLTGNIKTQSLANSAAVISISFLDSKQVRLKRYISSFYTGTNDWRKVNISQVNPPENASYAVIGCHLVQGEKKDIRGSVWFDELQLKQLPRLTLTSNFHTHFIRPNAPIVIEWKIKGLDPGTHDKNNYELILEMFNNKNKPIEPHKVKLKPDVRYNENGEGISIHVPENHEPWNVEPQEYGFYEVRATLYNNKSDKEKYKSENIIFEKSTYFTVIDFVEKMKIRNGDFGWSILNPLSKLNSSLNFTEMEDIIAQGGVQWLQYPVWQSVESAEGAQQLSEFFEQLSHKKVKSVGVLDEPPHQIRRQFAAKWQGVSEVFSMPPEFWKPSVESVVARNSTSIRHWQLGNNNDKSFVGLKTFDTTLKTVQSKFGEIGRDTRIGLPWKWKSKYSQKIKNSKTFLIMNSRFPDEYFDVKDKIIKRKAISAGEKIWLVIHPMSRKEAESKIKFEKLVQSGAIDGTEVQSKIYEEIASQSEYNKEDEVLIRKMRSTDLVKRMIAAKHAGTDVILASDVFNPNHGLLNENGSPGILFLPWRTTSLALSGAKLELERSFQLKEKSENYVYFRENEAIVVIWNDATTEDVPVEENIFLGENAFTTKNFWDIDGRLTQENDYRYGPHQIKVTPVPLIIQGCSRELAKWRMKVGFKNGQVASKSGDLRDEIRGFNPYNSPVTVKIGKIKSQSGWNITFPEKNEFSVEGKSYFRIPIEIELGSDSSIGDEELEIPFEIDAVHRDIVDATNQKTKNIFKKYKFSVYRTYKVGSDKISLSVVEMKDENGNLNIEVIITNETPEIMDFTCRLFVPGRNPLKKKIFNVRGAQHIIYKLPNAESLKDQHFSIKASQIRGDHILNHKWIVGETWEEDEIIRNRKARLEKIRGTKAVLLKRERFKQALIERRKIRSAQLPGNLNRN
jgi:hypothetical protein